MARIFTEFRIEHKTLEEKQEYEERLHKVLKKLMYKSRTEWLRQMVRDAVERAEKK
jgi:metal-responsive CopG/Arc/MetJ family transcriptional regulator